MTDIVRDPYGNPLKRDATITTLRAEVERLRAALELFACDCIDSGNLCPSPQNCRNYIARAAITQENTNDQA